MISTQPTPKFLTPSFHIKCLTVYLARVDQLYAFDYVPNPPFDTSDGWNIYNPREEFARMGIGSRSKAWRFTDVNKDYSVRK